MMTNYKLDGPQYASPEYTWLWVSPDGRIKHTYTPQTKAVWLFYLKRGWHNPCTVPKMKGEAQ